ncbi:MAG: carbamoyltransferase HypF [Eubacteriales bacterium]|nr:carbamoyltransferase HypF [Eubacteriales bacterium]
MSEALSYLIQIQGLVQGVGMRPFIYKTARSLNLTGFVQNKGACVIINISGEKGNINSFLYKLTHDLPSNARIDKLKKTFVSMQGYEKFEIRNSLNDNNRQGLILPDLAVCDDCMMDIMSSKDRRYKYAFTNCTNCGPRYSIINDLPYDRANTSMKSFPMCVDCTFEYENPENRRFHAQPNCCPVCGPRYDLRNNSGEKIECENPVLIAVQLLKEGKILAVKGIGGYHLVCNAQDENAISKLRKRKSRPHKPFAVMASQIEAAKKMCFLNQIEEDTLTNNKRPIVLLNKKNECILPDSIAPALHQYGVILPYTPLHYFLFDDTLRYLVMTSGNISGMPICYKDEDALNHLNKVADYFLIHNREIMTPIDDSVVKVMDQDVLISRCGRGYSPMSLPSYTSSELLALGGEQKASVCFIHKGTAHISQYLGDLSNLDAYNEYMQVQKRLSHLLKAKPQIVVHDLHPDYYSTQYAKKLELEAVAVQHHHAHMAGCMAEHSLTRDVIGIVFDGTGMGTDGTVWGGEFLVGNRANFQRAGHLEYITLQGADSVIKEPWKCAASYLYALNEDFSSFLPEIENFQLEVLKKALMNQVNCFDSSSMGRLFDCVAALVLHRTYISYDAQAAIELESIIDDTITEHYNYIIYESDAHGAFILGFENIIKGVLTDIKDEKPTALISTKFHNTICKATVACAIKLREKYKLNTVVLSGGVFENSYLLKIMRKELMESGFNVYHNKNVPLNDGGLSFGQAAVAASILEGKAYVPCSSGKVNRCTG